MNDIWHLQLSNNSLNQMKTPSPKQEQLLSDLCVLCQGDLHSPQAKPSSSFSGFKRIMRNLVFSGLELDMSYRGGFVIFWYVSVYRQNYSLNGDRIEPPFKYLNP